MLIKDFFERTYIPHRLRGKSANSVRLYRLTLKQFSLSMDREARLDDLTDDNLLLHLARRSEVSAATRNKELSQLLALWRFATQRGVHVGWPTVQKEHEPERAPVAWLSSEVHRLLDAAGKQEGDFSGVPRSLWWQTLIKLMLDTGERISAVRTAKWSWIRDGWLAVPAEARKGKTRDRTYRLSTETEQLLQQMRTVVIGEDVFPWPYCSNYLWPLYKRILKDADLPTTRKHVFHCFRKTVGSAIHAAGHNAQDALDHADRRTTQRYIDPRFQRETQPCDILATYLANPTASRDENRPATENRSA